MSSRCLQDVFKTNQCLLGWFFSPNWDFREPNWSKNMHWPIKLLFLLGMNYFHWLHQKHKPGKSWWTFQLACIKVGRCITLIVMPFSQMFVTKLQAKLSLVQILLKIQPYIKCSCWWLKKVKLYLEPCQISTMKLLWENTQLFSAFNFYCKNSILNIWQGSAYGSERTAKSLKKILNLLSTVYGRPLNLTG